MESLFSAKLAAQWKAPLVDAATKLFTKRWTGAAGQEVVVPSYKSFDLVVRNYNK